MRSSTQSDSGFAARFAKALARRLHPHADLRPKQLTVIGWSIDRIGEWLKGNAAPPGEAVYELARFFRQRGDGWFIVEVFGEQSEAEAARMSAEIEAMQRRLAELQAGLKGQSNVAPVQKGGRLGLVEATASPGREVGAHLERAEAATPVAPRAVEMAPR